MSLLICFSIIRADRLKDDQFPSALSQGAKEFIHQWIFPQQSLTLVEETGERRRYHLHETELQDALYHAVRRARIPKRVTAHTFRHSLPPISCRQATTSASFRSSSGTRA